MARLGLKIPKHRQTKFAKGIYLLPSILTLANILMGFYAIITVLNHYNDPDPSKYLFRAAVLILFAGIFDALDGRVARLTNSTSAFGAQLDSIADIVSFGLAPGVLAYGWALVGYRRLGWLPAFLFLACGSLRLARFNVQEDENDLTSKRYFIGLPIPAAAACVATLVMLKPQIQMKSLTSLIALIFMYGLSFLMVSSFHYRSFKDVDWRQRRPIGSLFFIVLIAIVIMHEPVLMLFLLSVLYVSSGLIAFFLPDATLNFFRRLDKALLGVRILDDDELMDSIPNTNSTKNSDETEGKIDE